MVAFGRHFNMEDVMACQCVIVVNTYKTNTYKGCTIKKEECQFVTN